MNKNQHFISNSTESPRIFKNDIMETFSKNPWYIPIFFWFPIIGILCYTAFQKGEMSAVLIVNLFLVGCFLWSLFEYALHRFIFHLEPKEKMGIKYRIHFLLHGFHHDYPNDKFRLVAPIPLALIIAVPIFGLLYLLSPTIWIAVVLFCGVIFGYVLYDCTHFFVHHTKLNWVFVKKMQKHHFFHHYTDKNKRYGVSLLGMMWDYVFGTV